MKPYLIIIFLFLLGCSWGTIFAVTNSSSDEISVSYGFERIFHHGEKKEYCPLDRFEMSKITNDGLSWWSSAEWKDADNAKIDSEKCVVSLSLDPGQSVMVTQKGTYTGHENRYGKESLGVSFLTIKSNVGQISMEGREALKRFEKIKTTLYAYEHK